MGRNESGRARHGPAASAELYLRCLLQCNAMTNLKMEPMGGRRRGAGGTASTAQNRAYLRERNECGACCYQPERPLFPDKLPLRAANPHGAPTDDKVNHRVADTGDAERSPIANAVGPRRARQGVLNASNACFPLSSTGTLVLQPVPPGGSNKFHSETARPARPPLASPCFSVSSEPGRRHGRDKTGECANLNSFEFWLRRARKWRFRSKRTEQCRQQQQK